MKELFTLVQREKYCELKGMVNRLVCCSVYPLTEAGRSRANTYGVVPVRGTIPVPLHQYIDMVKSQPVNSLTIDRRTVMAATEHLVLTAGTIDQLGEAVNSGWATFLYGPPGNGKTVWRKRLEKC